MNTVVAMVFELPCADAVAVGKKSSHASSMHVVDAQEVAIALAVLTKGDYPMEGLPTWGGGNATHLSHEDITTSHDPHVQVQSGR
jgi:hypothetical protein